MREVYRHDVEDQRGGPMKVFQFITILVLFAIAGCGTNERIPAGGTNNVQAPEQEQERYIYGGTAQVRESTR